MPFPMPLLVNITVKILFQSKCLENCYNWGVSIWSVKFVSPLTTRISVISLFPARRPWCNNSPKLLCPQYGKRTPKSVRRRSSRVDFRLRNPSSPDVVFVMKALFSILDPQNRVETNTCFVFAHDFVLAVRYLLFFSFLSYILQTPQNFCNASFSRIADHNYNIVTPPRNLSKGGNTGNGEER